MNRRETASSALEGRVFSEPWQAEAFAMAVALHERGLFSWSEWSERLSTRLKMAETAADGSDYYFHWLANLEAILNDKGAASAPEVDALAQSWQRAARATPHGQSIVLENDPGV